MVLWMVFMIIHTDHTAYPDFSWGVAIIIGFSFWGERFWDGPYYGIIFNSTIDNAFITNYHFSWRFFLDWYLVYCQRLRRKELQMQIHTWRWKFQIWKNIQLLLLNRNSINFQTSLIIGRLASYISFITDLFSFPIFGYKKCTTKCFLSPPILTEFFCPLIL